MSFQPLSSSGAEGPAASPAAWAQGINELASSHRVAGPAAAVRLPAGKTRAPRRALLTRDAPAGSGSGFGWRLAHDVAEQLANDGLDPDYLADLASASALEPRDLFDFVGIDRTTVGRRKASGSALPHDVAVKALVATELLAQANDVFGGAAPAASWLTRPHPMLDDQTPLRRARTPWGLSKVQGMLVALRYGSAA